MENPNQPISHPAQISPQRYNHQLQSTMWNNKVCQSSSGQNTSLDPYSQQMNQYYQAQYSSQTNDMNRYVSPVSKDQNSNPTYSQYPMARQANYSCTVPGQNYQMSVKANCNNMYYANATKNYAPNNVIHSSKKYMNSGIGLPQAHPAVPQSSQITRNTGTPMPQMPQYGDHTNYPMQNAYASNYNVHTNPENEQSYMLQQAMASPTTALSSQESLMHSVPMVSSNQVSQMSSIPTPPETSSLTGDGLSIVDNTSHDNTADNLKMNVSNSSFALPGSVIGHIPSSASSVANVAAMSHRNTGNSLQPPANLDEGSQASSASASSSIPDEQSSVKASSKPNFSYPPTPNTLSSPGAASMSSFHDDLECISSPGWPKTPASPVTNGNYEFANIKRPENLLKLYTLSDEPDRRYFLDKLIVFSEDRGSPLSQCPTISKQPLDVYRVYITVKERGGFVEVTNAKRWKDIAGAIGVGASSSAAYTLRKQYMKILLPFECKFDRGGIDPQPIINMVEASSRKKGKNAPGGTYGSQSHYSHGYPQSMDRYPPGYPGSYQSSRYQCNSSGIDYQCTSNTMHYPQSASNVPHNSTSGQIQYHQYSHSSSSNYRYYQGSNSTTNTGYNSNIPNSNDNLCRFGRSATSTPVPQEQGYYSHQFPTTQTEPNIQDIFGSSRACSTQENLSLPVTNQINDIEQLTPYETVNNSGDMIPLKSDTNVLSKPSTDNFGNINMEVSLTGSTSDPSQDNKICFNSSYSVPSKIVQDQSSVAKSFEGPTVPQAYQQSMSESTLTKTPEASYYPDSSAPSPYTNRNQTGYLNQVQTYANQKLQYQGDYQSKEQLQPNQYSRYSEGQNEPYRGSEGLPGLQVDRTRNIPVNDGIATKAYQYNCNVSPKTNTYAYASQQGQNKETLSHPVYSNQFSNRPQRTWHSEQNHHPYQQVGQRPQLKNQLGSHDGKQLLENSRPRRSWVPFQNSSASPQNKSQTVPSGSNATLSQSFLQIKTQPLSSSSTPLQSIVKKPFEFPPNTIESIRPVAVKRRRCPAKRLGSIDPWRLMLALKSGLLAECTWALDTLSILLADNSTVVYFNLDHLPGLLNVLCDHYRCFLNKIFNLATDMELKKVENIAEDSPSSYQNPDSSDVFSLEGKTNLLDTTNFTYKTRCNKKVEIQYDEALFLIDPQRSWDTYEDFNVSAEHWQKGGGDITSHIQTCFAEETKKVKFSRELKSKKTKVADIKHTDENKSNFFKSSLLYKGEPVVVLKKFKFDDKEDKTSNVESEMDTEDSCSIVFSTLDKKVDTSDEKNILEQDCAGSTNSLQSQYNKASMKLTDDSTKSSSIDFMDIDNLSADDSKYSIDSDGDLCKSSSVKENSTFVNESLSKVTTEKDISICSSEDIVKAISDNENVIDITEDIPEIENIIDITEDNPEKENTVVIPEKENAVVIPEKEPIIEVPEKENIIEIPEKENTMDIPEIGNVIDIPEKENKIVIPEKENAIVIPEKEDAIVIPEKENAIVIPEKENAIVIPEKEIIIEIPEKEKAIGIPEKENIIDITEDVPEKESLFDITEHVPEKENLIDITEDIPKNNNSVISNVDLAKATSEKMDTVPSNDDIAKASLDKENSIAPKDFNKTDSEEPKSATTDSHVIKSKSVNDKSAVLNVDPAKTASEIEKSATFNEDLTKKDDYVDSTKNLKAISKKENPPNSNEDLMKISCETENCVDFIDLTEPNPEKEKCVDFIDLTNPSSESENCVDLVDLTESNFQKESSIDSTCPTSSSEIESPVVSNDLKSISETENSIESIDLTKTSSEEDNSVESMDDPTKASSERGNFVGINVDLAKVSSEIDYAHSNDGVTNANSEESNIGNSNEDITKTDSQMPSASDAIQVKCNTKCDIKETSIIQGQSEICDGVKESTKSSEGATEKYPQLRGSLSSRKRFLCADLEDEAYSFDEPALCVTTDSQEMLSRRCVCVSTIIRNLSFVPNNDISMSKNPSVLILLGRLLLLHHEHRPVKNAYQKYETEAIGDCSWEDSCTSLKDEPEWWLGTLKVLRDNTLVILSNISGHLDLSPFPEEVSLPILDGLLHWVVCPSSYAQDPLPSRSPSSVLSPQRLCLETLCKLSVLSNNVDLIIATPPWSRIENLFEILIKNLCSGQDQIMREFALILLSNISQADTAAARTIAEQKCCISYLISFIEEAESKSFQIASSQGTKKLRDKPELMGTTPGMVQRAAQILRNLAVVPENRSLFIRHQTRLLALVMSQVMDQELAAIVADILFYSTDDMMSQFLSLFFS